MPPLAVLRRQAREMRADAGRRGVQEPRQDIALPAHFDWRDSGYVTLPARRQAMEDCWAFATVAVMETAFLKAARSHDLAMHLAPQAVVDCNPYGYTAERGGWWSFKVYQSASGGPTAANYPYAYGTQACKAFLPPEYRDMVAMYVADDPADYPSAHAIKEAILQKGAVGSIIYSTARFQGWSSTDAVFTELANFAPSPPDRRLNHAITLVGWDDAKGAWLVRNSYGTGWGRDGFAWVRYGENAIGFAAVWTEMSPTVHP